MSDDIRKVIEKGLTERADALLHEWSPQEFVVEATNLIMNVVREAGWDFVHTTDHYIDFNEHGWAIQHPTACRPNMLDCVIQKATTWHEDNNPEWRIREGEPLRGRFKIRMIRDWHGDVAPIFAIEYI